MSEKEVGEQRPFWVGIDVSKRTFDAAIHPCWEPGGDITLSSLPKQKFNRDVEGVGKLLGWIDAKCPDAEARVVMEATGCYSLELAGWLTEVRPSLVPVIADPKAVSHFIKSLRLRNKTDKTDAAALARFGAERNPQQAPAQSKEYEDLRQMSRERTYIVRSLTAASNRLEEIGVCKQVAELHKKLVGDMKKALAKIEDMIRRHVEAHANLQAAVERLDTIPGVAFTTAATILGELGDLTRFLTSRSLSAFAGTSPRLFESGESVKGKTRMCKQGSPRARQALYLACLAALRVKTPNSLSIFYQSLVAKGKPKMSAIGAMMRKMLVLMRALLVEQTDYDDEKARKKTINFA